MRSPSYLLSHLTPLRFTFVSPVHLMKTLRYPLLFVTFTPIFLSPSSFLMWTLYEVFILSVLIHCLTYVLHVFPLSYSKKKFYTLHPSVSRFSITQGKTFIQSSRVSCRVTFLGYFSSVIWFHQSSSPRRQSTDPKFRSNLVNLCNQLGRFGVKGTDVFPS